MKKICAFWSCGGWDVNQACLNTHRDRRGASLARISEDTCVQAAQVCRLWEVWSAPFTQNYQKLKFLSDLFHNVYQKTLDSNLCLNLLRVTKLKLLSLKVFSLNPTDWMFRLNAVQCRVESTKRVRVTLAVTLAVNDPVNWRKCRINISERKMPDLLLKMKSVGFNSGYPAYTQQ